MSQWYMLTLVGKDRPGIVAAVTGALYQGQCNLGEASMIRLGDSFTMMMMVKGQHSAQALSELLQPVTSNLDLHLHIDSIDGRLHNHLKPDVSVTVYGADRAGIVAQVTGALAEAGLHILDLETDVAGTEDKPIYILQIVGAAEKGIEALEKALAAANIREVQVNLQAIDTVIG